MFDLSSTLNLSFFFKFLSESGSEYLKAFFSSFPGSRLCIGPSSNVKTFGLF